MEVCYKFIQSSTKGVTEQGTQGHLMKSPARPEHEHCLLFVFYCNDIVF